MSDLTNVKKITLWPPKGKESSWLRLEPLLTAEVLRHLHLWGLPLVSSVPDPITRKHEMMSDALLDFYIRHAIAEVESETHLVIMETEIEERHPFDRFSWDAFGHMRLNQRPVWGIKSMTIAPADGTDIFTFPLEWIETGNLHKGQLNVMPMAIGISGGAAVPAGGTGLAWMAAYSGKFWVPAWFKVTYLAGFPDNKVPTIVNDLIGTVAAMAVLSQLAATNARQQGVSLSIDGLSQSISSPGPEVYQARLKDLQDKRQRIVGQLKMAFGQRFTVGHV